MNILVLGDVMGPSGIKAVKNRLPKIIQEKKDFDLTVTSRQESHQVEFKNIKINSIRITT